MFAFDELSWQGAGGSYEALLDLRGTAEITGCGSSPVDAAVLTTGFQVACQWQMDGVQLGVTGGPTAQMSISYPPAMVIGGQVMPSISTTLRNGTSTDVKFETKQLRGPKAGARMDEGESNVCGGTGSPSWCAQPQIRCLRIWSLRRGVNTWDSTRGNGSSCPPGTCFGIGPGSGLLEVIHRLLPQREWIVERLGNSSHHPFGV
ncbi:MspA family porin [Gordonia sp. (in: high G+C Gram-positive bacteria)]|uniref:MspA family porin n=1 Tax=Gordonia sp. (in: high G+C Gram-positive bacteria) TaxID=84139 RepID=UPI003C7815D2